MTSRRPARTTASAPSRLAVLAPPGALPPHPSRIIVTVDPVAELRPGLRGDYAVILGDGTRLRFSRRDRDEWPEISRAECDRGSRTED